MSVPLPMHIPGVTTDGDYWAPFGKKRWSAVRVVSVKAGVAEVTRVDASSNKPKTRRSKVKVSQLVERDSGLKGTDTPTSTPSEMCDEAEARECARAKSIAKSMARLPDTSTMDDW